MTPVDITGKMLAETTTASPSTHQLRKSSAAGGGSSSPYHQGGFHHYQGGQGYGNPQGRGNSSSTPSIPSALSAANRLDLMHLYCNTRGCSGFPRLNMALAT